MSHEVGHYVDFAAVPDIEEFREYFETAPDLGVLEKYRSKIERVNDLEVLRDVLEKEGPIVLPGYQR